MKVSTLTRHFIERWQERVGNTPEVAEVNAVLSRAQQTRRQKRLLAPLKSGGMQDTKVLAEFWSHADGLIIRVDIDTQKAITCFGARKDVR